jgi:hypothetical protein
LLGEREVRDAERRVATQKLRVRERWDDLRTHGREALVSPAALTAFAIVGGVAGWRSRRATRSNPAPAPRGVLRGIVSGLLQSLAAAAIEHALRSGRRTGVYRPDSEAGER